MESCQALLSNPSGTKGLCTVRFEHNFSAEHVGGSFALLAYVTVALGGFGNVPATLAGGVLVGLVEALGGLVLTPALKYSAVFAIYLAVVLWRPQGLFGRF